MELEELKFHVWRGRELQALRAALSTGFAELDRHLPGGGWPLGIVTEVFVDRYGIGELSLFAPALVQLTRPSAGEPAKWIAWIAPPMIPYAPALQQRGIDVARILLIHPSAAKECVWAVEQTLRSGSSAGVLAWVPAVDGVVLRRLQLAAEEQQCWVVLFRPIETLHQPSPAGLRLRLQRLPAALRVQIVKCRGGRQGRVDLPVPLRLARSSEPATGDAG
jgi:cell division inhibitor SulA/protein ImuA